MLPAYVYINNKIYVYYIHYSNVLTNNKPQNLTTLHNKIQIVTKNIKATTFITEYIYNY